MGVVYEAIQQSLNRRVAIKLLPLGALFDARQIARFKNEAHAAGLLQHPNIAPIYSVGSERGVHYFAMQFIDGVSLDAWCERERQRLNVADMPGQQGIANSQPDWSEWKTVVSWAIDIARALHLAHENGVIHRDVKPSNLMLDKSGKIWITDFGLARCQTEVSLTQSGDVIGTMRYMSPEQSRGQSALIDGRSDIYSLAATLYEILTLRPAHDGCDAPTILKMIDEHDVVALRNLRCDLPHDLDTVIAKAMSKSREDRYETAEQFADDLGRVLSGEPTIARPPTLLDRISRVASKHRSVVATGIVIVALGFVGFAIATAKLATAKAIADANSVKAERGETLARDAVDRLGSQMAELLADIPAAATVRRQLLMQTLDYYSRFSNEVENDPRLRKDLATTLGKMGELGDNSQSVETFARCEAIYAELAKSSVDDVILLEWSTSQNNYAQALVRAGLYQDAATYFAKAMVSQEGIVNRVQENAFSSSKDLEIYEECTLALAVTLNNLGLLLSQTGATDESERMYLKSIDLLSATSIAPASTVHSKVSQQLAAVRANLSGLLTSTSPERAIEFARQALDGQLAALEKDRGNARLATETIATLNTLGAAQSAANQHAAAVETFNRAIEIGQKMQQRWPDQPTYQRDLVLSLNHLGLAYSKLENLARARHAFDQSINLGRKLASDFSKDAETQSMIAGVLNNIGFLEQQLGSPQAASKAYDEAIQFQTLAVKLAPEVKRYQEYLSKHNVNRVKNERILSNSRRNESVKGSGFDGDSGR
jgi:tetratricopeptide (TPR) repeat protein